MDSDPSSNEISKTNDNVFINEYEEYCRFAKRNANVLEEVAKLVKKQEKTFKAIERAKNLKVIKAFKWISDLKVRYLKEYMDNLTDKFDRAIRFDLYFSEVDACRKAELDYLLDCETNNAMDDFIIRNVAMHKLFCEYSSNEKYNYAIRDINLEEVINNYNRLNCEGTNINEFELSKIIDEEVIKIITINSSEKSSVIDNFDVNPIKLYDEIEEKTYIARNAFEPTSDL